MSKTRRRTIEHGDWKPLPKQADVLGTTPSALRRKVERVAQQSPKGTKLVAFDGIYARKFAGRWKVALGEDWTTGTNATRRDSCDKV